MARKHYSTYGSVAYAPERTESVPKRGKSPQKAPQQTPQAKPNIRPLTRKRVEVREAGSISFDAIFGFIAAGTLATLLMTSYAELTTASDQVVQLRSQLSELSSQQMVLSAQYEKHFDIERIEETLGDQMMRPTNDQVVYIDLSQPDAVHVYDKESGPSQGFFSALFAIFS